MMNIQSVQCTMMKVVVDPDEGWRSGGAGTTWVALSLGPFVWRRPTYKVTTKQMTKWNTERKKFC